MKKKYENPSFKVTKSDKSGFVKVAVTYQANNKICHSSIYVKKQAGYQDNDYCKQAEKQFNASQSDTKVKPTKPTKPTDKKTASFKIPFIITLVAFVLAGGTFGILFGLGIIGGGGKGPSKTYEVHFLDKESQQEISETQTVEYDHVVQRPKTPVKEGYTFIDWFDAKDQLFNFDEKLTDLSIDKINVFGTFDINQYRVTYITNGGFIKDNKYFVDVNYGNTIATQPTVYKDEEYQELANATWYLDSGFTNEFKFGTTKVTSNLYLYAKYSETPVVAEKFGTDPWEVFLSEINNKSYEDIAGGAYKDDYESSDGKSANTFVGLTRSLSIENEKGVSTDYSIKVVDEDKNAQISDGKFTFMITNLNKSMKFAQLKNYYGDSEICLYLNGVLTGFPDTVKTHIQSSPIDCFDPHPTQDHPSGEMKTPVLSLYIPSASQIFGKDDTKYPDENSQFAYFNSQAKHAELNGAWLRTPDQVTQQKTLYVVGGNIDEDNVDKSHNIMPVFVIK